MKKENLEYYIHFMMSATGGFFGAYSIIICNDLFANAQTTNMMRITIGLTGDSPVAFLLRVLVLGMYIFGLVGSTLLPRFTKWNLHLTSVMINFLVMLILLFMPEGTNEYIALLPVFFASAFQWNSFKSVGGYVSATIFSTNNLKQFVTALTEYMLDHKSEQLHKAKIYGKTLLSYYGSAFICACACKVWDKNAILVAILPIVLSAWFICLKAGYFTAKQKSIA